MEFGELVTYLRRKAKMTQAELAKEIPVSPQYLNQIEKGRPVDSIGNHIIDQIGKVLSISPDELIKYKFGFSEAVKPVSSISPEMLNNQFDIERESWKTQVLMLKDIISAHEATIQGLREDVQFLRSMVKN